MGRFGVWESQIKFPEFILFKTSEQKWYEIKPSKVTMFSDDTQRYKKRLERYTKISEENKILEPQSRPPFML